MTTYTPDHVLFALRAVGKAWLYQDDGSRPGEPIGNSIISEFQNPVGLLALDLASKYGIRYNQSQDEFTLDHPGDVKELQVQAQGIGMRIPVPSRISLEVALQYIEQFGSMYLRFDNPCPRLYLQKWLNVPNSDSYLVNDPSFLRNDFYINPFLRIHLRDLFTDFELFEIFSSILSPVTETVKDRRELIDKIDEAYHPSGYFWVFFGFGTVRLEHHYHSNKQSYTKIASIISIAQNGQLIIPNLNLTLPYIGLYQLAFLSKPEYVFTIYGIQLTSTVNNMLRKIYRHFIRQIQLAERRGNPKLRFSDRWSSFNQDLDV